MPKQPRDRKVASMWPERDKLVVQELKEALEGGAPFRKYDREYIEAAHEQLESGSSLSSIQSYVIASIRRLEANTDDSE